MVSDIPEGYVAAHAPAGPPFALQPMLVVPAGGLAETVSVCAALAVKFAVTVAPPAGMTKEHVPLPLQVPPDQLANV